MLKSSFKLQSAWIFPKGIPRLQLPTKTTGVVVHTSRDGQTFEIELFDPNGKTISVETFDVKELIGLGVEELAYPLDSGPLTAKQVGAVRKDVAAHFPRGEQLSQDTLFVERGRAAIARSIADGDGIPADVVIAKLEAKVQAARNRRDQAKAK